MGLFIIIIIILADLDSGPVLDFNNNAFALVLLKMIQKIEIQSKITKLQII